MATRKKKVATHEDLLKSQRACQRLLGDPEIAAAFETIKDQYLESWAASQSDERDKREALYNRYKAVNSAWEEIRRKAASAQKRDVEERLKLKTNG